MIAKGKPRPPENSREPQPLSRGKRRFLWIFSIAMVVTAGSAFIIKLIEFIYEFSAASNTVPGGEGMRHGFFFAVSPLITYLIVAAGFACLFAWAYFSGQFRDVEAPKYRMLDMQDEIDRGVASYKL